jgi:hypothetical protein
MSYEVYEDSKSYLGYIGYDDDPWDEYQLKQAREDDKKNSEMKAKERDEFTKLERDEFTKLIAGLNSKEQIQNKIIKKLFNDSLDYMIYRYAKKEALPLEHVKIVQQQNCLAILIKGFLKKVGGFVLNSEIVDEITGFIEVTYMNNDLEIVYDRVAKIQKFIHEKIDKKHGKGAHRNLPIKHIRNLLSASRLHLNIFDIKYMDINSLSYLIDKSRETSNIVMINPTKIALPKGKKYIKNWRVRHMKSLLYYNKRDLRCKIHEISHLDRTLSLNMFKRVVIDICCTDEAVFYRDTRLVRNKD